MWAATSANGSTYSAATCCRSSFGSDARSLRSGGHRRNNLFTIFEVVASGPSLTLADRAKDAGLPITTAHRLLREWVRWGGLVRNEDGNSLALKRWRLGVRRPTAARR